MTEEFKITTASMLEITAREAAGELREKDARIAELEAALKDCADELETWVDDLYARGSVPAGYGTKYDRCVAAVEASRAVLKGEKE
jgi:coenzyme F420-reducing hydrogenase alpha subunit